MKFTKWSIVAIAGGIMNMYDKEQLKRIAYNKGYNLSQQFKCYRGWDEVIEPIIIKQIALLFGVSNSFVKGLISDNKPNQKLDESLKELENSIVNIDERKKD